MFHSQEDWATVVVEHYYGCLNADPDFQADLADLFERLADPMRQLERQGYDMGYRTPYPFQPLPVQDVPDAPAWWHQTLAWRRLYNHVGSELSAFCERWHLPTEYGLHDVFDTLAWHLWAADNRKPQGVRLSSGVRVRWYPTVGLPIVTDRIEVNGETVSVIWPTPVIVPNVPVPFLYDPTEQSREWLNKRIEAICDDIRQSIEAQAAVFEEQAKAQGWKPRPARYTGDYLQRVARALYLRAVKNMTWGAVADECSIYDPDGFARRVREFARQCGIPLKDGD